MLAFDPDFPSALPAKTSLQNDSYLLEGVIGQGGSGITYLATDIGLKRAVAIKEFFLPECVRVGLEVHPGNTLSTGDYEQAKEEFLEEARILAQFVHPGIVDVFGVFIENNTAYMVMEYLSGIDLEQMVDERGPLSEAEAIGYIRQVGAALEVVHREELLHRDIKPDNVVVQNDGSAVLIDFGITQKIQTGKGLGTRRLDSDSRLGTAGYAPLEQYSRQGQVSAYTDVYALAATLYHLVTGQVPVEATDRAAGVQLPDPRLVNPHLSAAVVEAIGQGLAMDARQRPQSVRAFLEILQSPQQQPPTQRYSPPAEQRPARPVETDPPEPIRIDIPGYTSTPPVPRSQTTPQRMPQPQRMPEPEPLDDFPEPYQRPPVPIIMPGFGCARGGGCIVGCLVMIVIFILQFLAAIFSAIS